MTAQQVSLMCGCHVNPATQLHCYLLLQNQWQSFAFFRVRIDIKMLFSRTCKDQIPGFSRTQKSFFPGLSKTCSIHKCGLHEAEKVHIQNQLSVYLHYSKEKNILQYNGISNIRFDPRGGNVLHVTAYCLATTQTKTNNSRLSRIFQDLCLFPELFRAWNSEQ